MDDVIEAIRTLLDNASLGYKKIYYGENKIPNLQSYPFIEVIPINSEIDNRGTGGLKDNVFTIQINFKHHLKKKFKANTDRLYIQHVRDLVKAMEERDSNSEFKSGTIMKVLSDDLQLNDTVDINGEWAIDYDEINDGENQIIVASVTFVARLITPH